MGKVLRCAYAGSFFPDNPVVLSDMVRSFLQNGSQPVQNAVGVVVPHAGYVYSGTTAGFGFAAAPDGVSTVVVCAPSHRVPFAGETVFDIEAVETPLGLCRVDREVTAALASGLNTMVFSEHSFEVMVPFIQVRWPGARIVPIIMGVQPDSLRVATLVHRLVPDAFFVASSDLSHFHPLHVANRLDRRVIDSFLTLSPESITDDLEACGRTAIRALLHYGVLRGATEARFLHYSTSADAGAGTEEVVGYFSGLVVA